MESTQHPQPKKSVVSRLKRRTTGIFKRFPLLSLAVVVALIMIATSSIYAAKLKSSDAASGGTFDTSKVLPQAVTIPPSAPHKEFTAETIKQYDGKDGHKCYVAVKGVVYEIADKGQWQNGEHTPSNGLAYCGADLSDAIDKSPHGSSKLEELPVVGTYK
jgi:predicted heme/steroid binding protein